MKILVALSKSSLDAFVTIKKLLDKTKTDYKSLEKTNMGIIVILNNPVFNKDVMHDVPLIENMLGDNYEYIGEGDYSNKKNTLTIHIKVPNTFIIARVE